MIIVYYDFSPACSIAASFSLYIWYMGTKNLVGLLLFVTVMAGILYFVDAPTQRDSLLAASAGSTKNISAAEREYSKLLSDIKFGLKQKGVMVKWRDDLLKRLEKLRKSGLSEKKVKEAKALIAQLRVGGESSGPQARSSGSYDRSKAVVFTHAFTDLSKINAINPIGGIGGGSPGRSYIGVKEGMEAPVYAPIAATLRALIYADRGAGYGEYGLIFRANCDIEFMFDHIDSISEKLKKYAPKTAAANSKVPGAEVSVKVAAGELLGYTNGTDLAHTFDFLVTDYSKKNRYLNPKRWEWDQAIYSVCPYDFFTAKLKAQYYAKLGKPAGTGFIKAATCGDPMHDVAGTLSGGWFKGTSTDKKGEYLAIARQYDEVTVAYRKDGDAFNTREDVQKGRPYLNITDMTPGIYPEGVLPGGSICYSGNNMWTYISLTSSTSLKLAKGAGECPAAFPESGAETWIR